MHKILVWDVPTRLFHWLFAASFAGAWLTAESDAWLGVHSLLGYLMLGLIGFRLVWGLAGGRYARFSHFAHTPAEGVAYLKKTLDGKARRYLGHNPAGSQAVYLLLSLGVLVAVAGLFVLGGEENLGPLAAWVSIDVGRGFKEVHEFLATAMLVVVVGHLLGVALESWRHQENLTRAMLTGYKYSAQQAPATRSHWLSALALLAVVAGFALWWIQADSQDGPVTRLTTLPLWQEECGSCHLGYHPSLLPARSWEKLMAGQATHFGEDLGLGPAEISTLLVYARAHAAEAHATEAAWKVDRSLAAADAPLRISETSYWVRKHREIRTWNTAMVHGKSDCAACHRDAATGLFEDQAIHRPG